MNSRGFDRTGKPVAFRHELKYVISNIEQGRLRSRFGGLLRQDANAGPAGLYRIRSLYFDDYWNTAYHDKLMGVNNRYKYRIRIYNDSDQEIFLEKKIKQGNYIAKETAKLNREDADRIMRGDYIPFIDDAQPLCRSFYCACMTDILRPRVMIDYEREPYVYEAGDVRITFDSGIRAGIWSLDLFDANLPMMSVLEPDQLIMEVKFTELLPDFIRSALPVNSAAPVAVSKYVLGCDRTIYAAR